MLNQFENLIIPTIAERGYNEAYFNRFVDEDDLCDHSEWRIDRNGFEIVNQLINNAFLHENRLTNGFNTLRY